MPNVSEKKLKLLYIAQLLLEKTDEDHAVTLPQMLEMLEAKGIPAERKSLYDDLETLRRFGFPIETRKSRTFAYYLSQRTFSPGDVALLAEAVRQAPGLSPRKVSQLLKKLGTLCSQYQAQALLSGGPVEESPAQEETVPEPAAPSPEELLRRAIQRGVQVAFQAVTWELASAGMALRQEEAVTASPWWLYCQDGVLWLLATDTATGQARRFPLRQVSQVRLLPQVREGEEFLPAVEKFTLEFPQVCCPRWPAALTALWLWSTWAKPGCAPPGKPPWMGSSSAGCSPWGTPCASPAPRPPPSSCGSRPKRWEKPISHNKEVPL